MPFNEIFLCLPVRAVSCIVTDYEYDVIVSFRHKGLEALFSTGSKWGVQPHHAPKLLRMLDMLDFANNPEELILEGFRTHQLSGDLDGFWSMRVNGSWRLTYRFVGEDVEMVDYQDYH